MHPSPRSYHIRYRTNVRTDGLTPRSLRCMLAGCCLRPAPPLRLSPPRRTSRPSTRLVATMSAIQRFEVGPRMSEASKFGGVIHLAGQVAEDSSADLAGQTAQVLAQARAWAAVPSQRACGVCYSAARGRQPLAASATRLTPLAAGRRTARAGGHNLHNIEYHRQRGSEPIAGHRHDRLRAGGVCRRHLRQLLSSGGQRVCQ